MFEYLLEYAVELALGAVSIATLVYATPAKNATPIIPAIELTPEEQLKQAINNNDLATVKTLLPTLTSNTNNKDTQGKTFLHLAVEKDNPNILIIRELLNHKDIEPNAQDNNAKTPYDIIAEKMVTQGQTDPNYKNMQNIKNLLGSKEPLLTKLKRSLIAFCNSTLGTAIISILGITAIAITSKFIGEKLFPETTKKISDQLSNVFGYFTTKSDHAKQLAEQVTAQVTKSK